MAAATPKLEKPNVVLVHGGFADGSGWEGVYKILKGAGVATADRMIPPDAQRFMSKRAGSTVVEAEGSHAIYVSKPAPVAELIQTAAAELRSAN